MGRIQKKNDGAMMAYFNVPPTNMLYSAQMGATRTDHVQPGPGFC
jgi:hypothetical protein